MNNYRLQILQPNAGNASYYSEDGKLEFYYNDRMSFLTGDKESSANDDNCAIYSGWQFG